MPKINVYLPDDLAEAVKETGIPVSAVCQRALEQAVRRMSALREMAAGDLSTAELAAGLPMFTPRSRVMLKLATEQARAEGAAEVGTEHLLAGLLAEGGNLALQVMQALDIDPDRIATDLQQRSSTGSTDRAAEPGTAPQLSAPAGAALELAVSEASALGHDYVGSEHLLLGLITEPDGTGGQVLRAAGAELRLTRRAVVSALAGFRHLSAQTSGAGPALSLRTALQQELQLQLQPLIERIDRLEGLAGGH